jgi:hypothetical protein
MAELSKVIGAKVLSISPVKWATNPNSQVFLNEFLEFANYFT